MKRSKRDRQRRAKSKRQRELTRRNKAQLAVRALTGQAWADFTPGETVRVYTENAHSRESV